MRQASYAPPRSDALLGKRLGVPQADAWGLQRSASGVAERLVARLRAHVGTGAWLREFGTGNRIDALRLHIVNVNLLQKVIDAVIVAVIARAVAEQPHARLAVHRAYKGCSGRHSTPR